MVGLKHFNHNLSNAKTVRCESNPKVDYL